MNAPAVRGFDAWDSDAYLADYYARVEPDEQLTLRFLVRQMRRIGPCTRALEFGTGPTLHHLLPLLPHCAELHVADYLPGNLQRIRDWCQRRSGAHDWRPFTRYVLGCEGRTDASEFELHARDALLRRRLTRLLAGDAGRPQPLRLPGRYDLVVSCYCADSATGDAATWRRFVAGILGLVRPGGWIVMAALRRCRAYRVGAHWFPGAGIDEHDIADAFARGGVERAGRRIEVEAVPQHRDLGYEGIVLASGRVGRPCRLVA